jgi:spore germination protein Q
MSNGNVNYNFPAAGQQGMMSGYGQQGMMPGFGQPAAMYGQPMMQGFGQPGAAMPAAMTGPMPASGATIPTPAAGPGMLPAEESFIENILRLNLGKVATIYMTFENNSQWNAKIFKGVLEAAGRDHIIISDPRTGMRYLLLMVNLDYITFDEELNYNL